MNYMYCSANDDTIHYLKPTVTRTRYKNFFEYYLNLDHLVANGTSIEKIYLVIGPLGRQ